MSTREISFPCYAEVKEAVERLRSFVKNRE